MRQRNDSGYTVHSHDVGREIGDGEKFEHPKRVTGCTQLYAEDSEPADTGDSGDASDDQDQQDQADDGQGDGDGPAENKPPKARSRRRGQDGDPA